MKGKLKKIFAGTMGAAMICAALAGCTGRAPEGSEPVNTDQLQLYIGVYEGGLGSDWVYALKKDFEDKYADVTFGDKKGVQLRISESKAFTGEFGTSGTVNMSQEVIFAEGAATLYCAERGDFLDISDVVTKPLNYDFVRKSTGSGESATIESKLNQDQRDYYSAIDGKYYALPTAEAYMGLAYDIEVFEDNNLYFAPDGSFVTGPDAERSSGPDGDPSTEWDNGLPQTYEQFYTLCAKIKNDLKMIPVMWGGALQEMVSFLLLSLEADNVGAEQMYLNYDYDGTLEKPITSFDGSGNPQFGADVPITAATGYELYKQSGKYYALKFIEGIIENGYYNVDNGTSSAFTHQDAEGVFVSAKYNTNMTRAAMLVDGNWWQSEAKGVFADWEAEKGAEASMQNRKFGMMPFPKASAEELGPMTLLTYQGHVGFINSHIDAEKVDIAKAFLQYCYTEEALRTYTVTTNICRPVTYDMGDAYDQLSTHGKMCVDLHTSANKVSMESASKINRNYNTQIWYAPELWKSTVGGTTYTYPSLAMINNGISAEDYFMGMRAYWTPSVWSATFKNV